MSEVMVSVCMITYNHEAFIKEAIEGVLMQQTSFPIELVIGEDCSTDRTREICIEYQQKYPDKIRLLLNEKNLGMMPNFIQTLNACTGKYIALCEGDDYWTDPLKLQKQVDFLEENEAYAICFHDVEVVFENKVPEKGKGFEYEGNKDEFTFDDLLFTGNLMHTPSVVFRRQEKTFPEIDAVTGDYFLHLYNAYYGKIKRLREKMACYRVHDNGVFSNRGNWDPKRRLEFFLKQLKAFEFFKKHFSKNKKHIQHYNEIIAGLLNNIRIYALIIGDYRMAREASIEQVKFFSRLCKEGPKKIFGVFLSLIFPEILGGKFRKSFQKMT